MHNMHVCAKAEDAVIHNTCWPKATVANKCPSRGIDLVPHAAKLLKNSMQRVKTIQNNGMHSRTGGTIVSQSDNVSNYCEAKGLTSQRPIQ